MNRPLVSNKKRITRRQPLASSVEKTITGFAIAPSKIIRRLLPAERLEVEEEDEEEEEEDKAEVIAFERSKRKTKMETKKRTMLM